MSSEDVIYIDRDRILIDEDDVLNDVFCPICFCLLWKPRSCNFCQNLFCNKCIQNWLNENSHTCPLCRSLYEDKPVSSLTQSILSHYSIRCRNFSFGCTEILSYDFLEEHENFHCQFLTKQCRICKEMVLVNGMEEHQNICKPIVIQCSVCQYSVRTELFERHQEECLQRYEDFILPPNFPAQTILSTTSTVDFLGIEIFNQSRDRNCFIRFYAMLQLILLNLPLIHLILLNLLGLGCGNLIRILTNSWIHRSIYQRFIFSILSNYCLFYLLQSINDIFLISFLISSLIIWSSLNPNLQITQFQMNFNLKEILLFLILIFLFLEIPLLIIRFYFDHLSLPIGAICFALIFFSFSKYSQKSNYFS